jgi:uncharacterized protein YbjT (DUF2867 family)
MRIFLAGASGVLGARLMPLLVGAGHTVAGMTRTAAKAPLLRALGAVPYVLDVYDEAALREAVGSFRPDVVMHQLTDLPDDRGQMAAHAAANARVRRVGTALLLAAAQGAGARQFLAQSVAWTLDGDAGDAAADLERQVLDAGGVVLRYGRLYGPGTHFAAAPPPPPRIHVDAAARATLEALAAPVPGVETGPSGGRIVHLIEATA